MPGGISETAVPEDDAAAYADAALQLAANARERLARREQLEAFTKTSKCRSRRFLARMERRRHGGRSARTATRSRKEIDDSDRSAAKKNLRFCGRRIQHRLAAATRYDSLRKLGIPSGKKNKTGWGTGVEVLQGLAREYPICALVLEYREVTKLKNTYIDVIPKLMDQRDGRLRTDLQSNGDRDGPALVDEPEPAKHSRARRAGPAHSPRVRCAEVATACCSPPITVRSNCG